MAAAPPASKAPSTQAPVLDRDASLKRAAEAVQAGRRDEALRLLRSAASRFESVRVLLELARLQSEGGDDAGALASLDRARALAPSSEDVLGAHAELSAKAHRLRAALHDLEALTRLWPTVAQHHYALGTALLETGDAALAQDALQEADRLEPGRAATLVALGRALNGQQLYAQAKPILLRSLELEPASGAAAAALAEAQEGLGETTEAESQAQRALARAPHDATASLVLGLVRVKQGRNDEALAALLAAVAAAPASPRPRQALSALYTVLGDATNARLQGEAHDRLARELEQRVRATRGEIGLAPRAPAAARP